MNQATILVVDDEESIRKSLLRLLEKQDHQCAGARDAGEARAQLEAATFDLVLCDVNMPGESGLDLVEFILGRYPETAVVMVTGIDDPQIARVAIEAGAYGYIVKPFTQNEILINLENAMHRRRLESECRNDRTELARLLQERTEELWRSLQREVRGQEQIRTSVEEIAERLSIAAEVRDSETSAHLDRMSNYSGVLATEIGLARELVADITLASRLHDVGKIGVPDRVLRKQGLFTEADRQAMFVHPQVGYEIFSGSHAELLRLAGDIALNHHERWDGSGYPRGIAGKAVPLPARIAAVADVFDALMSKRPYKPAWPLGRVVETIQDGRESLFDPEIVDVFTESIPKLLEITDQYA